MTYSPRTTEAGIWDNPYWYSYTYNRGAQNYLWIPNCTTYAYGRSVEIAGGQIDRDTIMNGSMPNAANWYDAAVWPKSPGATDVRLGDIVVWGPGGGVGAAGHVAVVEAITDTHIYTSNSHYMVNGQTQSYPGLQAKRYFEFAEHPLDLTYYTRIYYYNQNGSVGPTYSAWSCPNLIGTIHNPYAESGPTPPEPPTGNTALLVAMLERKKKKWKHILMTS